MRVLKCESPGEIFAGKISPIEHIELLDLNTLTFYNNKHLFNSLIVMGAHRLTQAQNPLDVLCTP